MSESSVPPAVRPRLSQRLRLFAVLTTLLTVAICVALLWSAFSAFFSDSDDAIGRQDEVPGTLVVAVGRTPGGPGEWISYAAAFANLQDDLGRPVQLRYIAEGSAMADLFRDGQTDIALVTVGTYLELDATGDATLVAAPVVAGQERDAAVLVVSRRSEVEALEGLRGQPVVLTQGSLSGDKYAQWLMRENATTPGDFFGQILFAESQDTALGDVDTGRATAACVRRSGLASWPTDAFRVVASSPEFGMPPVIARADLDPALVEAVRASLLGFDAASRLPSSALLERFVPAAADDYAFARTLDELPASGGTP